MATTKLMIFAVSSEFVILKGKQSIRTTYSYGHLPVITGYKWDYTFYKWGHNWL